MTIAPALPAVSTRPGQLAVIVDTGNNFSIPSAAATCVKKAGSNVAQQLACLDPTDYVEAVIGLDLTHGTLKWSRRLGGADTWTAACNKGFTTCPSPQGPDFDFGSAPNLEAVPNFTGVADDRGGKSNGFFVGAGQKSGVYWGLNPSNGGVFWASQVGGGGILWGTAVDLSDRQLVFASLDNGRSHTMNKLAGQNGTPVNWNAGAWGAINVMTGKMLWQVPAYGNDLINPTFGSSAGGPSSFTNRVLFTGSSSGYFVALDTATGDRLWAFNSGGTVESAPAIFNETLYWGTGYAHGGGKANHKLFAFAVP